MAAFRQLSTFHISARSSPAHRARPENRLSFDLTKTPSLDPMLHAGQHDLARKIGVVGLRARSSKYSNGFESFDFNLGQKRANPNQLKSRPRSFCVPTRQSNRNDVRGGTFETRPICAVRSTPGSRSPGSCGRLLGNDQRSGRLCRCARSPPAPLCVNGPALKRRGLPVVALGRET